ncbi:hypothetical protein, partial [Citrobacter farmeri]|uniref:hypothetical protein n=1 Tax=Citrobacter farmeri TaxID=67824 RepID=UPI0022267F53
MSTTLIQYGKRINPRGILFTLMLSAFIWSCLPVSALADAVVRHGNGLARNSSRLTDPTCPSGGDWISAGDGAAIVGNGCNILFGDVYIPKAGMYFIRFYVGLRSNHSVREYADSTKFYLDGFAPIFPDICYHLTHYRPAAADIPVASDNPA